MLKAINGWLRYRAAKKEQEAIDARNAERRALCAEYAIITDQVRKGQILHRLAVMNGEADIRGAVARLGYEMDGICRRTEQVEMMRAALNPAFEHDHFPGDMKHFSREYCE